MSLPKDVTCPNLRTFARLSWQVRGTRRGREQIFSAEALLQAIYYSSSHSLFFRAVTASLQRELVGAEKMAIVVLFDVEEYSQTKYNVSGE